MTEGTISTPQKKQLKVPLLQNIWQNPVVLKELRSRMRGARAFILLFAYLIILSCVVASIFTLVLASSNTSVTSGPSLTQGLGKGIFLSVVGIELTLVCFIAPALTAGAIANERERQTFDLLRTTLLSARSLVFGKYFSSVAFLLLLLVSAFPIQSLATMLGGVSIEEVFISFLILVVSAIFFSAVGLFSSSIMRRTLPSTVLAYAYTIAITFGIPMVMVFMLGFLGASFSGYPAIQNNILIQVIFYIFGYFIVSLNAVTAGGATEMMLQYNQNAFYTTIPLQNGSSFPVFAPWLTFAVLYLIGTLLLLFVSVTLVRRVER